MSVIEVEGLTKSYGEVRAVDGVSLRVEQGEIFGILGPNGAGKTTTVECLQGLRRYDTGSVRVLGLDPATDERALRIRIGSQLQESALPDRMRVSEALDLFASVRRGGPDWRELLDTWGLAGQADTSFGALSGGQRQRLFIALALVNEPELVFLDELTQGLDPAARRLAWSLIRQVRDRGATVVLVTHYMDEVEQLCDRVAVIDRGTVVASGTPQDLVTGTEGYVTIRFSTIADDLTFLQVIPEVATIDRHGHEVTVTGEGPVLALVAAALVNNGIVPDDLRVDQLSLDDVYLQLTSSDGAV